MSTSTRLKGNVNPIFCLKTGAGPAVTSYADDLKKWEQVPAKKDDSDLTFAEAAAGLGVDWAFKGTALVSWDAGSLFTMLYDNAGADLAIKLGPKGNATATATSPHFTGTVTVTLPPGFGNEARTTPEGAEFEFELAWTAVPTKVTS